MNDIEITHFPVALFKVLQIAGLADSGGQAKWMIDDGQVQLNGMVERQKRKQCHCLDEVKLGDDVVRLVSRD